MTMFLHYAPPLKFDFNSQFGFACLRCFGYGISFPLFLFLFSFPGCTISYGGNNIQNGVFS